MAIVFEDRPSDGPLVERVWRSHSDAQQWMTSVASAHWTLVAWRYGPGRRVAVQGPEQGAWSAPVPVDTEFVGIRLALGTRLAQLPTDRLVDDAVEFPDLFGDSMRLWGRTLPLPHHDDAETWSGGTS